jgi:hypothetical protein
VRARDILSGGESGVVIFTDGSNLHIDDASKGTTGNWKMDPNRQFDKVIIYKRDRETRTNVVYLAIPMGITESPEEGRYVIELANIRRVGITDENWPGFSEGGRNPIRYLP